MAKSSWHIRAGRFHLAEFKGGSQASVLSLSGLGKSRYMFSDVK